MNGRVERDGGEGLVGWGLWFAASWKCRIWVEKGGLDRTPAGEMQESWREGEASQRGENAHALGLEGV